MRNPLSSHVSTAGNRVDIFIPEIRTFLDVTLVNNANAQDILYFKSFESKHDSKNKLHLSKVRLLHCDYFAPVFSTDGSASPRTKAFIQSTYNNYLSNLESDAKRLKIKNGSTLNHFLNLICFQINMDNALHALLLPQKSLLSSKMKILENSLLSDDDRLLHLKVVSDMRALNE